MKESDMVKTTGKEFFYLVSGLRAPKYMVNATIENDIEMFIDWVSNNTSELESITEDNDPISIASIFFPRMGELYVLLCSIYAHWLEMEAARLLRLAETGEDDICKRLIVPFIANVRLLALDIQMAQNKGSETNVKKRGKVENYKDVISGMRAITFLLQKSEFDKALDIAANIDELRESEYAAQFMKSIKSENKEITISLAELIITTYNKKIDTVISMLTGAAENKRILLVDDMPDTLAAISYMLKEHYRVYAFTNGVEALELIDKNKIDAFILDVDMPIMDGFTLAGSIRERAQYKNTPILFLTGNSTRQTLIRSLNYGAKAFIVKPASKNIIISKLSACLLA